MASVVVIARAPSRHIELVNVGDLKSCRADSMQSENDDLYRDNVD